MGFDGNSYIYRQGTTPNTRSLISSKVKVYSYIAGGTERSFSQIGVISSFAPSHSRSVEALRGIGFGDQIAELLPGISEPITIDVDRTALYLLNLFQVFGYRGGVDGLVRGLKHHRWPFDIKQEIVFSELATNSPGAGLGGARTATDGISTALLTFYEACWMESYGTTFASDTMLVTETSTVRASDVVDGQSVYNEFIPSGNNPFVYEEQPGSMRFAEGGLGAPRPLRGAR